MTRWNVNVQFNSMNNCQSSVGELSLKRYGSCSLGAYHLPIETYTEAESKGNTTGIKINGILFDGEV
jgi:hypothetical protein